MTDLLSRTLVPSPDAADSAVGDETVILHLTNGTYYGLDEVGTQIWALLKLGVPLADIPARLASQYGQDEATMERDVRKFLGDLDRQGLLVDA